MSSPSKLLHRSCKVFNYMQREELCRNLFWWIQKTFLKILVNPTIVRIWNFKPFRESMTLYIGELQGYLYSNFLFLNNFTIFLLVLSLTFTPSEGTPYMQREEHFLRTRHSFISPRQGKFCN
jgi:hypothetical protein